MRASESRRSQFDGRHYWIGMMVVVRFDLTGVREQGMYSRIPREPGRPRHFHRKVRLGIGNRTCPGPKSISFGALRGSELAEERW